MKDLNWRFVARILVESTTPLAIGAGEKRLSTDRRVSRDISGLPYIPGTSLKGVLKHSLCYRNYNHEDQKVWDDIFGFQIGNSGLGSRLRISSGCFVGLDGAVFEGLMNPDWENTFYKSFKNLPVRDHVRITDRGVAANGAKFDEEVVFKGTRFVFELELSGKQDDIETWSKIINTFSLSDFRIGGGTSRGFGEIKVIKMQVRNYNLLESSDFNDYLEKSSSLSVPFADWNYVDSLSVTSDCTEYLLKLKPVDFFIFEAGQGSDDADITQVTEDTIEWNNDSPNLIKNNLLIPASSVKGAIAHRVAFHNNRKNGLFVDKFENLTSLVTHALTCKYLIPDYFDSNEKEDVEKLLTIYNPAVIDLFGYSVVSGDSSIVKLKEKAKGKVLISDVFKPSFKTKILNHVAIDRFTGGSIDGALFSEEVAALNDDETIILKIVLSKKPNDNSISCLELALKDIVNGMLPLGGGVMRGNGCFSGEIFKNGEKLL